MVTVMSDLTNKRKEKISAFLDNDIHHDELMSFSLSGEPDDAKTALRYQMMGDVLRGEMSEASFVDVSHAVREAIAGEHLAVESTMGQKDETRSATATSSSASRPAWHLSSWFRPVAGMAVAVTVAVVMVFSLSDKGVGSHAPLASKVETQPAVLQLAVDKKVGDEDPQVDQRLVNQHLEYATQDALQGRLPYVRAVSYENKK